MTSISFIWVKSLITQWFSLVISTMRIWIEIPSGQKKSALCCTTCVFCFDMCVISIYIYIYIYTDIHIFVRAFHSVLQISFILHHKAIYIFKQPINNIFAITFFILEYIMIMCEISRPCASNFNGGSMT